MCPFRFNQGSQKVKGGVQRVAIRPTCAEKVGRLEHALPLGLSNRPTSSNLTAHTHPRICAYTYARPPVRARKLRNLGWEVGQYYVLIKFFPSNLSSNHKNRLDGLSGGLA